MARKIRENIGAGTSASGSKHHRSLCSALKRLRIEWEFFPVHVCLLFLEVAHADFAGKPLTVRGAAEKVGMNDATTSRNLRVLAGGVGGRGGGIQHDIVELHVDPTDYRSRLVKLTERGASLYRQVLSEMDRA